jgi:hypothetical protein
MTDATRQALERVAQILHEAGWDQPSQEDGPASSAGLSGLNEEAKQLVRNIRDDLRRLRELGVQQPLDVISAGIEGARE